MNLIIPSTHYTFDASAKSIALSSTYDMLTIEQVVAIRNLTNHQLIYDCENTNRGNISIGSSAISFTYSGSMAGTDDLQIIINENFRGAISTDNVSVFTSETLAASGESGHSVDSTGDYTGDCEFLNIYVSSTGSSTDLSVTILGSPDAAGEIKATIQPLTFGGAASPVIVPIAKPPNYTWISAVNGDAVNGAVFSAKIEKHKRKG